MRKYCLATKAQFNVCCSRQPSSTLNKATTTLANKEEEAFRVIDKGNNLSNYSKDIAINPKLLNSLALQQ